MPPPSPPDPDPDALLLASPPSCPSCCRPAMGGRAGLCRACYERGLRRAKRAARIEARTTADALASAHIGHAIRYARRHCRLRGASWLADEIESEALVILVRASRAWKGRAKFTTYLSKSIGYAVDNALASRWRRDAAEGGAGRGVPTRPVAMALARPVDPRPDADPADAALLAEERREFWAAYRGMPREHSEVLRRRFGLGSVGAPQRHNEVAARMGRTRAWQDRAVAEAIEIMRGRMGTRLGIEAA